jgi:hypothetical protein
MTLKQSIVHCVPWHAHITFILTWRASDWKEMEVEVLPEGDEVALSLVVEGAPMPAWLTRVMDRRPLWKTAMASTLKIQVWCDQAKEKRTRVQ